MGVLIATTVRVKHRPKPARLTEVPDPYAQQLSLDMRHLNQTLAKPADFVLTDRYSNFTFVLPEDFVNAGNPTIKNYLVYADKDNIEGLQFTFSNEQAEIQTQLFGKAKDIHGA